ncbi:NADH dehydrogenase FAD-containing subunit [Rubrobacter radiotolerans]|uniref:FAD-dependent oxidoreductase n=1 Tax=Rubrobacter radiotolerans TaxID=42256 RepID=A0A023X2D9_RUBRA|nr:FAD-dependent oxidoreductase [Rubrobacter radiotolerans]AHY46386.1 NADH dehydrogenase FAD-containing subunit [Rubrobacter radiotolerans]MDX5893793.1 FAD-dependent oxidoreductase [Rubrobacter radiotolerans]SMC04514.1 NADH dehydrogenase [Rubrobacter radiotolerans DSM 5868]
MAGPDAGRAERTDGPEHYRLIVVGAGFAGASAVRDLRSDGFAPDETLLIDAFSQYTYRPLIHEVASGSLSPKSVLSRNAALCRGRARFLQAHVAELSPKLRRLRTGDGAQFSYDYLVLATGASPARPPEEFAGHFQLFWSLDDALKLRSELARVWEAATAPEGLVDKADSTVAIVGGGTTGVELACEVGALFRELRRRSGPARRPASGRPRVVLLEGSERLMGWLDPYFHRTALRRLGELGVEVRLSALVEEAGPAEVVLPDGPLAARTKVWAAGLAVGGLASGLPGERDSSGRLRVTRHLTVPDHPEIYVIGDASVHEDRRHGPLPPTASVAVQQGPFVARDLARRAAGRRERPGYEHFDRGYVVGLGPGDAVAEALGRKFSGRAAHALYRSVLLFYLRGRERRALALADWSLGRLGRLGFRGQSSVIRGS